MESQVLEPELELTVRITLQLSGGIELFEDPVTNPVSIGDASEELLKLAPGQVVFQL
jgi:hypothetical protein